MIEPLKNHKITLFLKRIKIVEINNFKKCSCKTFYNITYAMPFQIVKRKITIFLGFILQKNEY
jgi:hypothetical protein